MIEADGTLDVQSCSFINNGAYEGAGIYSSGRLSVKHSSFQGNAASAFGGGIAFKSSLSGFVFRSSVSFSNLFFYFLFDWL